MESQINRTVAVAQWNTGEIPKNEHETPFLIIHVPFNIREAQNQGGKSSGTYQVETIHSSPFEQALAYRR